ncbi:MAG: beta-N-acetylhexosaminidase [Gammaproteobacteria bacterium]|nr:beta-N-acetylhexosaminidase [Gammaproteobacteria bacterium]NIN62935.1 beta-N-acetylhexosaminidase [Gammaproteobacteria bacterium]NIO63916.1 beta-N-acetylhexosaminidase [Gammaproteobacteria bacterium]NIP50294.1 beta-N-acetylhexosaminidase [Gammaproteobacteria bacterium]NIQ12514.1 beta-N-acetylhexosaminidase [Gammaproteobacteria bacterium]
MSLGPIMMDLESTSLSGEERELLCHPLVGGLILFTRNYESREQLRNLIDSVHQIRKPSLMIAVDHEGGRVQRFRQGFTRLPAAGLVGEYCKIHPDQGFALAEKAGWLMAVELRAVGIDFSFAPVLDLNKGISQVIGDRAFGRDPDLVAQIARSYMLGMKRAGMAAVGKHFPGHGAVSEDSHHEIPVDRRRYEDIELDDLIPFERLIHAGLPAIMPAHVIYSEVDMHPAGFSSVWLKKILRQQLGFQGIIFSDDINMEGAGIVGDFLQRSYTALEAGCDMVLVCNNRDAVIQVLDNLEYSHDPALQARLIRMHGKNTTDLAELDSSSEWMEVSKEIAALDMAPELDLGNDTV